MATETSPLTAFLERYEAAWNGRDATAMAPLITEDIVWHDPALPEPARGIPAVQGFMRMSWDAFPDLRFSEPDPPHISVEGDGIAWAWRMQGTMRGTLEPPGFAPTGRSMDVLGVDLWRMRDGRIAHYQAFYDMNAVAVQLGLVPAPGSAMERMAVRMQRLQARLKR